MDLKPALHQNIEVKNKACNFDVEKYEMFSWLNPDSKYLSVGAKQTSPGHPMQVGLKYTNYSNCS